MQNPEVQTVEKVVRAVVGEVFRMRASVPRFSRNGTYEKRVSVPVSQSTQPQITQPLVPQSTPQSALTSTAKKLRSDELLLDKQIITLRDVEHLPRSVQRLIVPQTALLTPSVRDQLSEQQIRLARYSAESIQELCTASTPSQSSINRVRQGLLEVYSLFTPYHPESLFPHWTRRGWHPNLRAGFVCFDGIRNSMVKNETLNVLFTSHVDEALCRLHRDEKIRAIYSTHPEKLTQQWKLFPGVNTLIVNPTEVGIYLAGQVVMRGAELFYS